MNGPHFVIEDGAYNARIIFLLAQSLLKRQDAITDLFDLTYPTLLALCRARLGRPLQSLDEDVASYVWESFILQYQAGVFPRVHDAIGLWGTLSDKVHWRVQRVAMQQAKRNQRIEPVTADGYDPLCS